MIGLGVYLLTTGFSLSYVTIGLIIAGLLALLSGCAGTCKKYTCLVCLLLTLITLFLFITGMISFIFAGVLVIPIILGSLGILAINLNTLCLILKFRRITVYGDSSGSCK